MVRTIVERQLVLLAVKGELTLADTVTITSDESGAINLVGFNKSLNAVEALDNIGYIAILVGNHDCADSAAIIGDCHFVTFAVTQNV